MKWWLTRLVIATILVSLVACGTPHTAWPMAARGAAPAIPSYPGASEERRDAQPHTVYVAARGDVAGTQTRLLFLTADPPAAVYRFYVDRLVADGWRGSGQKVGERWEFNSWQACPIYSLSLYIESKAAGATSVRIVSQPSDCADR